LRKEKDRERKLEMPEGPEVTVIRDQLHFNLAGTTLKEIISLTSRYPRELFNQLPLPIRLKEVKSKGKLLCFVFSKDEDEVKSGTVKTEYYMYSSLGMTGEWGCVRKKHSHVYFHFVDNNSNDWTLFYTDVRRFGRMEVSQSLTKFESIAPPIIGENIITKNNFVAKMSQLKASKSKNTDLVKVLMDQQKVCSGIGNYMLSEILYACKIDPSAKVGGLSVEQIQDLYEHAVSIANESYHQGGVSISDFVDLSGTPGKYQNYLKVYGREGKLDSSGKVIKRITGVHGRSIFFV
jgi:formamidopyrimidine-DNA glycosylase